MLVCVCLVEILNVHAKPQKLKPSRDTIDIINQPLFIAQKKWKILRYNWHLNPSPKGYCKTLWDIRMKLPIFLHYILQFPFHIHFDSRNEKMEERNKVYHR